MSNVANASNKVEETVSKLAPFCHVCEVKAPWILVHASPAGLARIVAELGLPVHPSKKGGDYYAVKVPNVALVPVAKPALPNHPLDRVAAVAKPSAPIADDCPVPAPEVVPAVRRTVDPVRETGTVKLDIRGTEYIVRQTTPKRRIDVLRYEVRKDAGDVITEPYVVSFQDEAGHSGACSCPDWIYRRKQKGDCKHIHAVRAALVKPKQATIPITATA